MNRNGRLLKLGILLAAFGAASFLGVQEWRTGEAAGAGPEMHIAIADGPGVDCSGTPGATPPNLVCEVGGGVSFLVDIDGTRPAAGPDDVAGYQSELFPNGLTYTSATCAVQNLMEPEFLCLGPTIGPSGQISLGNVTGLLQPLPDWTNPPNIARHTLRCPTSGPGEFEVVLTAAPNTTFGSKMKGPSGEDILLKTRANALVDENTLDAEPGVVMPVADVVQVNCGEPPPVQCGDVNKGGTVDSIDAALVLQYTAAFLMTINATTSDVNNSGGVDAIDAALILQLNAGLIPPSVLDCG
jgi:hypothetical protein